MSSRSLKSSRPALFLVFFLGYRLQPGGKSPGEYLCVPLTAMRTKIDDKAKRIPVYCVREIYFKTDVPPEFPMKAIKDAVNRLRPMPQLALEEGDIVDDELGETLETALEERVEEIKIVEVKEGETDETIVNTTNDEWLVKETLAISSSQRHSVFGLVCFRISGELSDATWL